MQPGTKVSPCTKPGKVLLERAAAIEFPEVDCQAFNQLRHASDFVHQRVLTGKL